MIGPYFEGPYLLSHGVVFIYLHFEDLSFKDKVTEWPMADFFIPY